MKRRRQMPEQGSMLLLMGAPAPREKGVRLAEPAITRLETDQDGNVLVMCHEPVLDPLDDPEEEAAFVAYYCDAAKG